MDSFSQIIIWLKSLDNNRAVTTYEYFQNAIEEYQYLLQVRRDKGVENRMIAKYIIVIRGYEMRSFISDKSTHNTRIDFGANIT